jgi:hypothetical protein
VIPTTKIYSSDTSKYLQKSVRQRIEALFLNNVGLIVTRDQIRDAAKDPKTGVDPENWHQRLGVCQRSCPLISCGVSDFRGADFVFGVEPDGSGGLPVAGSS